MWEVLEDERCFPIYFSGLVLESHSALRGGGIGRLLQEAKAGLDGEASARRAVALARHFQRTMSVSFNQAGCVIGEVRAWKRAGWPLPAPPLSYHEPSREADAKRALDKVAGAMRSLSAGLEPDEAWRPWAWAGLQRSLPEAPCLRASMSYRWVPREIDYDHDPRAWLNLECVATVHDGVRLSLYFEDELGWQFDEAWRQAHQCVLATLAPRRRRSLPRAQPFQVRMPTADRRFFSTLRPHNRPERPAPLPPEGFLLGTLSGRLTPAERLTSLEAATNARKALQMVESGQAGGGLPFADAAVALVDFSAFRSIRGFLHLAMGDTNRAEHDFDAAFRNNIRNPDQYRGLAATYHRQGKLQKALALCNSSLVWGLADSRLYELRGLINHDLGNYGPAEDDYREARRLRSRTAPAPRRTD